MTYDWKGAAERQQTQSKKIGPGYHLVTGRRIVRLAPSADGAPKILLAVETADGLEGAVVFTLSTRAAWTLARWLSRSGVALDELTGTDPAGFCDPYLADRYLLGWPVWVLASVGKNPQYIDIEPVRHEDVPEEDLARERDRPPIEDVPF